VVDRTGSAHQDQGELERGEGKATLKFTRRLPHPPAQVWRALSEPEHLAAWFPTTIEGERTAGAPLRFEHTANAAPPMDGEMLVFEPPSLMELQWGEEDTLRFELRQEGSDGCLLIFTATFDELGKAARDGAGWHACLDLLGYEIEGLDAPWSSADRWRQVRMSYIERFGADASRLGPPEDWEKAHGSAS
jgi:uncharacterized protein YndB with AHSA1/START domain